MEGSHESSNKAVVLRTIFRTTPDLYSSMVIKVESSLKFPVIYNKRGAER